MLSIKPDFQLVFTVPHVPHALIYADPILLVLKLCLTGLKKYNGSTATANLIVSVQVVFI